MSRTIRQDIENSLLEMAKVKARLSNIVRAIGEKKIMAKTRFQQRKMPISDPQTSRDVNRTKKPVWRRKVLWGFWVGPLIAVIKRKGHEGRLDCPRSRFQHLSPTAQAFKQEHSGSLLKVLKPVHESFLKLSDYRSHGLILKAWINDDGMLFKIQNM